MIHSDQRSVGELLLDAEQRARELLHEAPERDGLAMANTWGEVVDTAAELWHLLPPEAAPVPLQSPTRKRDVMDQLQHSAKSLHARTRAASADFDDALVTMSGNYSRAAELVAKYPLRGPLSTGQREDARSTRTRIMHTLYLTSHSVSVALQSNLRAEQAKRGGMNRSAGLVDAYRRVNAHEHLVGTHLDPTHPETLTGQHRDPVVANRLGEAFSTWDVAAHRALAARPTTRTLALIAGQQMLLTRLGHRLWLAAAATGHVDASHLRSRLDPALEHVGECWDRAHRAWDRLTPRSDPSEPRDLRLAAGELLAAHRELTHDRVAAATPHVIAARTDIEGLVSTLERALASSVDLSYTYRDAAAGEALMVAPRPAFALINNRIEQGQCPDSPAASVSPAALASNRSIHIPTPLRTPLRALGESTVNASVEALGAATGLDRTTRASSATSVQASLQQRRPQAKERTETPGTGSRQSAGLSR
ncbi:MAG: hypothetical protein WA892_00595 [Ornithinimicrobium sp.]